MQRKQFITAIFVPLFVLIFMGMRVAGDFSAIHDPACAHIESCAMLADAFDDDKLQHLPATIDIPRISTLLHLPVPVYTSFNEESHRFTSLSVTVQLPPRASPFC